MEEELRKKQEQDEHGSEERRAGLPGAGERRRES